MFALIAAVVVSCILVFTLLMIIFNPGPKGGVPYARMEGWSGGDDAECDADRANREKNHKKDG